MNAEILLLYTLPWIFCRDDIQNLGEYYIPMKAYDDRKFKWENILKTLSAKGASLVMIEGGAVVINDVLAQRMADVIIISISPVILGRDGLGTSNNLTREEYYYCRTNQEGLGGTEVISSLPVFAEDSFCSYISACNQVNQNLEGYAALWLGI